MVHRALMLRDPGNSPNYNQMVADLAFGELDSAMTALERSVANREGVLLTISIPCDPMLDVLKSKPAFDTLMRKLGTKACPATIQWPRK